MDGVKGINLAWFHSYLTNQIQYNLITHDILKQTLRISVAGIGW